MRVQFKTKSAGPKGVIWPKDIVEVSDREAALLVQGGYAVYVDMPHIFIPEAKTKKTKRTKKRETQQAETGQGETTGEDQEPEDQADEATEETQTEEEEEAGAVDEAEDGAPDVETTQAE